MNFAHAGAKDEVWLSSCNALHGRGSPAYVSLFQAKKVVLKR
jgi:hypothetical protein